MRVVFSMLGTAALASFSQAAALPTHVLQTPDMPPVEKFNMSQIAILDAVIADRTNTTASRRLECTVASAIDSVINIRMLSRLFGAKRKRILFQSATGALSPQAAVNQWESSTDYFNELIQIDFKAKVVRQLLKCSGLHFPLSEIEDIGKTVLKAREDKDEDNKDDDDDDDDDNDDDDKDDDKDDDDKDDDDKDDDDKDDDDKDDDDKDDDKDRKNNFEAYLESLAVSAAKNTTDKNALLSIFHRALQPHLEAGKLDRRSAEDSIDDYLSDDAFQAIQHGFADLDFSAENIITTENAFPPGESPTSVQPSAVEKSDLINDSHGPGPENNITVDFDELVEDVNDLFAKLRNAIEKTQQNRPYGKRQTSVAGEDLAEMVDNFLAARG